VTFADWHLGRPLRYLIGSEYGWLGAMGFAAPALHLADRDRGIGWTVEQRRASLHTLVNMSRFLIRPSVHCANPASRLLAMAVERLPEDFEHRFNYRPWQTGSFPAREGNRQRYLCVPAGARLPIQIGVGCGCRP